jgi:flagellar motor protein MotB
MKRHLARWACGAAILAAAAAAGCASSSQREQMQQDAKDKQILELTERSHRLEQDVAERDSKISALATQQPADAPAAKTPPAAPRGRAVPPVEVSAALREKGVHSAVVDGRTALRIPGSIFGSGSATVTATSQSTLKQVADLVKKQHPAGRIRVEGHTDSDPIVKSRNHFKSNQELSEARAKAVRDALVSAGLDRGRFEVVGRGAANPVADNKTSDGKRQNRRVELVFLGD